MLFRQIEYFQAIIETGNSFTEKVSFLSTM